MKSLYSLLKGHTEEAVGYGVFLLAAVFILANKQPETVGLGLGVAAILYVLTSGNIVVAFSLGAFVGLVALHYSRTPWPWPVPMPRLMNVEGFEEEANVDMVEEEEDIDVVESPAPPKKRKAAKRKGKAPPPDNGDRAEFLTLGKKYKLPSEGDDEDYHLDAGTTFMNAYKSLKPDQIASMSKDTQELMQTQKQLMGTLSTLKPLIQDGKEMMNMFTSYFGQGAQVN